MTPKSLYKSCVDIVTTDFPLDVVKSNLPTTIYHDILRESYERKRICERVISFGQIELTPSSNTYMLLKTLDSYQIDEYIAFLFGHLVLDYYRITTQNLHIAIYNCCQICFYEHFFPETQYARNLWDEMHIEPFHVVCHKVCDNFDLSQKIQKNRYYCDYCCFRPLYNVYLPEFCQYDLCDNHFGAHTWPVTGKRVSDDIWQDVKQCL